jgi:hypothetical protein
MASQTWFYEYAGKRIGPVSADDMRSLAERGAITPDTPVKNGPNVSWFPAKRVQGLFSASDKSQADDPATPRGVRNMEPAEVVTATNEPEGNSPPPMPIAVFTADRGQTSAEIRLARRFFRRVVIIIVSVVLVAFLTIAGVIGLVIKVSNTARPTWKPSARLLRQNSLQSHGATVVVRPFSTTLYLASGKHYLAPTYQLPYYSIAISYKCGDEWKDDIAGYVPVNGKPEKVELSIADPQVCEVEYSQAGSRLVPKQTGKTVIRATLVGRTLEIPIEVIVLPVKYQAKADEVLKSIGFPDSRQVINNHYTEHWKYRRWPGAILVVFSDMTLYTIETSADQ